MYFRQFLILASVCAMANAVVMFTNSDYSGVTFDQPFTITWTGATGLVNLLLKNGPPWNQLLVGTIADGLSGNSFTWYPEGVLPEGIYNLEITDTSGGVNYSPQFRIDHGINYDDGSDDDDEHHPTVVPGHFHHNASATSTTEIHAPQSTGISEQNATVTSSIAFQNGTGSVTPTKTGISPPTSSVATAKAAHYELPLQRLKFSLLGALVLAFAN